MNNNQGKNPLVSVIMGIYNCDKTLAEAVDCIINQSYTNWELILCDDGSVDETLSVALEYKSKYPEKIIVLKNKENRGLNYTLNKCLKYAHGEYIARMDGDDLCDPYRFEKELKVFAEESTIDIVSTDMDFFDENGKWGLIAHPTYPSKTDFMRESPFCHAPCMVKKTAIDAVKGYTNKKILLRVEDYHLWMKLYQAGFRGKNIHEALYSMRDDRAAYSRRKFKFRINEAYVKYLIMKNFKLPLYNMLYVVRPIIIGLLPGFVYDFLRKKRLHSH